MMGSGKTTIAKLLSVKMPSYKFVDTDLLITEKVNLSINDIFALKGESEFRKIESGVLADVLKNDNQIISTGGGIIKSEYNIKLLKENSVVFYLSADVQTLFNRLKNSNDRPLLNDENIREKINELLALRIPMYEQAHFTVDTIGKSPDEIVSEIIKECEIL